VACHAQRPRQSAWRAQLSALGGQAKSRVGREGALSAPGEGARLLLCAEAGRLKFAVGAEWRPFLEPERLRQERVRRRRKAIRPGDRFRAGQWRRAQDYRVIVGVVERGGSVVAGNQRISWVS